MSCTDIPVHNFELVKGDDEKVTFRYLADGSPVNLTGSVVTLECAEVTLNRTMTLAVPGSGEVTTTFTAAQTAGLTRVNIAYKIIRWPSGLAGTKKTLFAGKIKLTDGGL